MRSPSLKLEKHEDLGKSYRLNKVKKAAPFNRKD